jgi:hypothetical protein
MNKTDPEKRELMFGPVYIEWLKKIIEEETHNKYKQKDISEIFASVIERIGL